MFGELIAKVFARRAAAASPDRAVQAMLGAQRAVKSLIDARTDSSIRERLAKSTLPADDRGRMHRIAKSLPADQREVVFKAIDSLSEISKAADAIVCKEIGHGFGGGESAGDALERIELAAASTAAGVRKSDGTPLTKEQAFAEAIRRDPSLYAQYKAERRQRLGWPS